MHSYVLFKARLPLWFSVNVICNVGYIIIVASCRMAESWNTGDMFLSAGHYNE